MTQIVWMGFMEMFSTLKFKALHCFLFFVIFHQRKKRKKPKQSASPPPESFAMYFTLRGMDSLHPSERSRGERGGDYYG